MNTCTIIEKGYFSWDYGDFMLSFEKGIVLSKKIIESVIFLCQSRTKQTYFTRRGKLNFENLIYFMLNFTRKSVQLELDNFFEDVLMKDYTVTKQAYSQARDKISHTAFIMLSDICLVLMVFYMLF